MFLKKQEVIVCEIEINCPGIPTYRGVRLIPAMPDTVKLIKNELRRLFRENGLEASSDAFRVKVEETGRKVIYPLFQLQRYCKRCEMTAAQAGVENEAFVCCGHCGQPTDFIITDEV